MHRLIVRHVGGDGGSRFVVTRASDHRDADPVEVVSPLGFPVEGSPESDLVAELRWYLEEFLEYPFPPRTVRAERVQESLRAWGRQAFEALFDRGRGRDFYREATREGLSELCLEVRSDDPRVLAWPWEVLEDPETSRLALGCQVERRLNRVADPPRLSSELPRDRVNILLVIARPYARDVAYRSIARPLVELIEEQGLPANVTVLRPPTFERLQQVLREHPDTFHILHFDGHGGYGQEPPEEGGVSPFRQQAPVGRLVFETVEGKPDLVDSEKLSTLLREYRLPVVVLNACRSGMVDQEAEDAFASVAAALLRGGVRSVVAMAYALYVSGAREFLPSFYRGLFESGDVGQAVRSGRRKMYETPGRVCAVGTYALADWLAPVVYRQAELDFSFASQAAVARASSEAPPLPEEAQDSRNPYGFIGRDSALLALERAMRRSPAGILIQGLGGIGKTTLARGFLKWLSQTGGLGAGVVWTTFSEVRTAEFVVNQLVAAVFDADALAAPMEEKIEAVTQALRETPVVVVWDNFESASGSEGTGVPGLLTPEDREWLRRLLEKLRGGRTKVLITSRGEEDWLASTNRFKLPIGGLHGEERWEFCGRILDDFGLTPSREDPDTVELMEVLGGHPLMMRAVLPKLETMSAGAILEAVRGNLVALGTSGDEQYDKVMATLRFVEESLPEEVRPLLIPLGLHERFVDADDLVVVGDGLEGDWSADRVEGFLGALAVAGLVSPRGQNIFELHPALTGFLRATASSGPLRESWERAFVDRMSAIANHYAPKALHEQRGVFHVHEANFHHALSLAARLEMGADLRALTESLAAYALHTRSLADAERLYDELMAHEREAGDAKGEASACHQLGMVAQARRDFEGAKKRYLKALATWEKQGDEGGAAVAYSGLGSVARECRDFKSAKKWYRKCLAIEERRGNERGAVITYHQLGVIAQQRGALKGAERWYRKSLAISEKRDDEYRAAVTYHQLGTVAQERGDLKNAEKWYRKSLAIEEKLADEEGAADTYYELGTVAEKRRDLEGAERLYLKSLAIEERQGNKHGAAISYHQLGVLAWRREDFEGSAAWLIRCVETFVRCNDQRMAEGSSRAFLAMLAEAPELLKPRLREMWERAGLPPLPAGKAERGRLGKLVSKLSRSPGGT